VVVVEKRMQPTASPLFDQILWDEVTLPVASVNEVGVGCRAGPVIAEAVILPRNASLNGVTDSKLLTAKRRATLFDAIREGAVAIGVGRVEDYRGTLKCIGSFLASG
jgi:Ribonuclease HII